MPARAEHERAHAGRQLLGEHRLDEVVVGAGVEAALEVGRLTERAADQDRHVRDRGVAFERLAQAVAVELGHLDVGDDEIRSLDARDDERLGAVVRRHDLVAVVLEDRDGVAVDHRRVVDEQDQLLRAGGRADDVEHLGVGERDLQEAVRVDVARDVAVAGEPDDDRGDGSEHRDGVAQRAIRQAARQQHRARRQRRELLLELGDARDADDLVAERLERTTRELGEHRLVADDHDVHDPPV